MENENRDTAREIPQDIKREWLSVLRRLQSVSRSGGASLIQITVLCDKDGSPILWTEPKKTLIEPKSKAQELISLLTSL